MNISFEVLKEHLFIRKENKYYLCRPNNTRVVTNDAISYNKAILKKEAYKGRTHRDGISSHVYQNMLTKLKYGSYEYKKDIDFSKVIYGLLTWTIKNKELGLLDWILARPNISDACKILKSFEWKSIISELFDAFDAFDNGEMLLMYLDRLHSASKEYDIRQDICKESLKRNCILIFNEFAFDKNSDLSSYFYFACAEMSSNKAFDSVFKNIKKYCEENRKEIDADLKKALLIAVFANNPITTKGVLELIELYYPNEKVVVDLSTLKVLEAETTAIGVLNILQRYSNVSLEISNPIAFFERHISGGNVELMQFAFENVHLPQSINMFILDNAITDGNKVVLKWLLENNKNQVEVQDYHFSLADGIERLLVKKEIIDTLNDFKPTLV